MGSFIGGSAFGMANQIAEGYILISVATLRKFQPFELRELSVELEKLAREVRAEIPAPDDTLALQKRNRRLGRVNQAQLQIKTHEQQRR